MMELPAGSVQSRLPRIAYSYALPDGMAARATMLYTVDRQALLSGLQTGISHWLQSLPAGRHSYSVDLAVPAPNDDARALLADCCSALTPWLGAHARLQLTIALTHRGSQWIGCTNAVEPFDDRGALGQMRVIDYAFELARLEARNAAIEAEQRAQRRAHPVTQPVALPPRIKAEIARYLRLEYGEAAKAPGSLRASDLVFVGEFTIDGVPTQYWRYPSSAAGGFEWATVERFDDHYALGCADGPPPDCR